MSDSLVVIAKQSFGVGEIVYLYKKTSSYRIVSVDYACEWFKCIDMASGEQFVANKKMLVKRIMYNEIWEEING